MSFGSEGKRIKFLKGTTFSFESLGKLTFKCVKPNLVITVLSVDESNSVQSLKYLSCYQNSQSLLKLFHTFLCGWVA